MNMEFVSATKAPTNDGSNVDESFMHSMNRKTLAFPRTLSRTSSGYRKGQLTLSNETAPRPAA